MTNTEFNKKYEKYIEPRFYGLGFNIPEVTGFLDGLFENSLIKIPGFKYYQIKIKFGFSRVYTNLNDHTNRAIEKAIEKIIEKTKQEV